MPDTTKRSENFSEILSIGGKTNSLGRVNEVINTVLDDRSMLSDLYDCLFDPDAWARMRAADALEKVCREHPDWLQPYIVKIQNDLKDTTQPSVQWHIAQIYTQVHLTAAQKDLAIKWLIELISTTKVDWIVSANVMDALVYFGQRNDISMSKVVELIKIQQGHHSKAVVRRATKLLEKLES